eukprot:351491-Chlamydomonas_euryale.AAC.40
MLVSVFALFASVDRACHFCAGCSPLHVLSKASVAHPAVSALCRIARQPAAPAPQRCTPRMHRYDVICPESFVPEMWMLRYPETERGCGQPYQITAFLAGALKVTR